MHYNELQTILTETDPRDWTLISYFALGTHDPHHHLTCRAVYTRNLALALECSVLGVPLDSAVESRLLACGELRADRFRVHALFHGVPVM